ncbi:hypothetical protein NE237_004559 [Protea cynaroides]|uniref:Uncharacterized protein n=1 Tax=Protea cynaroides TaxID=273540 RepID=A0A9Q0QTP9_9MAGN|nr:hypothetical protein NE237_004559 [Protea cynaroides]
MCMCFKVSGGSRASASLRTPPYEPSSGCSSKEKEGRSASEGRHLCWRSWSLGSVSLVDGVLPMKVFTEVGGGQPLGSVSSVGGDRSLGLSYQLVFTSIERGQPLGSVSLIGGDRPLGSVSLVNGVRLVKVFILLGEGLHFHLCPFSSLKGLTSGEVFIATSAYLARLKGLTSREVFIANLVY